MTFYNIIFGILFLAATGELLLAIVHLDFSRLGMAGTLALIIFNDTIYTSHVIEENRTPYSITMKLMDLLNFLFLSFAVLAISPTRNTFNIKIPEGFFNNNHVTIFWGLLVLYWIIAIIWNIHSNAYPEGQASWKKAVRYFFWVPFFAMFLITLMVSEGQLATWGAITVFSIIIAYVLAYKPLTMK